MRAADPETTLQKLSFIVANVWDHANRLTTTISLFALSMLVILRWFKGQFQKTWWIYRLPEVLIVVGLSTCKCIFPSAGLWADADCTSPVWPISMGQRRSGHPWCSFGVNRRELYREPTAKEQLEVPSSHDVYSSVSSVAAHLPSRISHPLG